MTPEEFLKKEGYFDNPHFPFDHVAGLMYRYAQSQHDGKPLVSGALPPIPDWIIKYDQLNYRSGAGKAIRFLMERIKELERGRQ